MDEKQDPEEFPQDLPEEIPLGIPEVLVHCYNHPQVRAMTQCPRCSIYYCNQCLMIRWGKLLCQSCIAVMEAEKAEVRGGGPELLEGERDPYDDLAPDVGPIFSPDAGILGEDGTLANPIKRLFGFAVDIVMTRILVVILFWLLGFVIPVVGETIFYRIATGGFKNLMLNIVYYRPLYLWPIVDIIYFTLSYAFTGRTFGMTLLNMRLVTVEGDFLSLHQAFVRALVLIITLPFGYVTIPFNQLRQSLPDLAASICVVNFSGIKRVDPDDTVFIRI